MSAEAVAFLSAIRANPADDTARLVFADWLEEHGNDPVRAAFIRAGMAHPAAVVNVSRHALVSRDEVWTLNFAELPTAVAPGLTVRLREELPDPNTHPTIQGFTYRRGLVESVRLPWDTWTYENTPDVLAQVYPLTRVDLTDEPHVEFWRHDTHASHAWVRGKWVSAPHGATSGAIKTLHFCGLRWPGITFTSPRTRR